MGRKHHWIISTGGHWKCDYDTSYNVSTGDFWKVYVRWSTHSCNNFVIGQSVSEKEKKSNENSNAYKRPSGYMTGIQMILNLKVFLTCKSTKNTISLDLGEIQDCGIWQGERNWKHFSSRKPNVWKLKSIIIIKFLRTWLVHELPHFPRWFCRVVTVQLVVIGHL